MKVKKGRFESQDGSEKAGEQQDGKCDTIKGRQGGGKEDECSDSNNLINQGVSLHTHYPSLPLALTHTRTHTHACS